MRTPLLHIITRLISAAALVVGVLTLPAAKVSADEPKVTKIVLRPAAEPVPALKYRLLPTLLERRPGNAAISYNKLGFNFTRKLGEDDGKIAEWLDLPLEKFPRDEVRKLLGGYDRLLSELHDAARRSDCDWQLPIGEQKFFTILLPEVQQMRGYARVVLLKARLQIVDGKYDDAIESIKTAMALGTHVARGQTLINDLVGIAITNLAANAALLELSQQPGAPNLYWAITSLPRPLIDPRAALESESASLDLSYPKIRNLDLANNDPAYWQSLINEVQTDIQSWVTPQNRIADSQVALAIISLQVYPEAKRLLVARGFKEKEVVAMPVAKVLVLSTLQSYRELRDDTFKWMFVSFSEGGKYQAELQQKLFARQERREALPLATVFLPALEHVHLAYARNQRNFDLLRTVEALRLYAAAHDGKLPASLGDVTEVPVPLDPLTGQPFGYRLEGGHAVLESILPGAKPLPGNGIRYEIELAK